MEYNFKILEQMWVYYYSYLDIDPCEYDIYDKVIDKLKNKTLDFNEENLNIILKIINILFYLGDEFELNQLDILKQIINKLV